LRDVRPGLLGVEKARNPLFGSLPQAVFATRSKREGKESEERKMEVQHRPQVEMTDQERRIDYLQRELARHREALEIYERAILGVIDCHDTVNREGTQITMARVLQLCQFAYIEAANVLIETADLETLPEAPFCTGCNTYLSESSQVAGYCLKCTHEIIKK
jgi:hypothetical protein